MLYLWILHCRAQTLFIVLSFKFCATLRFAVILSLLNMIIALKFIVSWPLILVSYHVNLDIQIHLIGRKLGCFQMIRNMEGYSHDQ